jgi:tetratricopeptide (TPR) repeat protein
LIHRRFALALALTFVMALSAHAQTLTRRIDPRNSDVALVRFYTGGLADPQAKNIAVIDASGGQVPYRLLAHDPAGQTVLAVDLAGKSQPLSVKYGVGVVNEAKPDDAVQPSLLMQVYPLTRGSFKDMADLVKSLDNVKPLGTELVPHIWYAHNPFGGPDRYLMYFHGRIKVEQAETLKLFSAHDDAAIVEIDGKVVTGGPTANRNQQAEAAIKRSVSVSLSPGSHVVRYVTINQAGAPLALLGHAKDKSADPLASGYYVHHQWAELGPASSEGEKPAIGFDARQVDQLAHEKFIFTRVALKPAAPPPAGMKYRWDFGDSTKWVQTAKPQANPDEPSSNEDPYAFEHVFPDNKTAGASWKVKLELIDAEGKVAAEATSVIRNFIFADLHLVDEPATVLGYADAIAKADYSAADPNLMAALYAVVSVTEKPQLMAPLTGPFVERFGNRGGQVLWDMKYALATHLARDQPERAEKLYNELARTATDSWMGACAAAEQLDLLIFRLGKTQDLRSLVAPFFAGREPRERALLKARLGDALRVQGKIDEAEAAYREAASENRKSREDQKKAAVIERAYRETAIAYLDQHRYPALRDILFQWEADFPLAKMGGDLPLLKGRYYQEVGDDPRAALEFETLLKLNPLHPSRPELVFRLAQSQQRIGKKAEAKALYQEMMDKYPNSPHASEAERELRFMSIEERVTE